MKENFENLTQYEKTLSYKARFGALYRMYISKLWSHFIKDGKSWIFNSLMILPIVAGPLIAVVRSDLSTNAYFSLYSDIMFTGYFGLIIPLFTMYIAVMLFNDEINDRTITYLTIRPINRLELVIIKYIAYLTIIPAFTAITSFLVYLSFGVLGHFEFFMMGIWYSLAAIIASIVYGALFMFIGLLFKNPLWFGLFFVFIWEFVLASFSQTLNSLTVAYYIKSFIVTDIYPNDPFQDSPAIVFGQGNSAEDYSFYNSPANPVTYGIVLGVVIIISLILSWAQLQGDKFSVPYHAGRRPGGWKYYLKEIRTFLISLGIVFITIGAVIAPVTGTSRNTVRTYEDSFSMYRYDYWQDTPTLEDMGFGLSLPYSFSKGDQADISFSLSYATQNENISYLIYGAVVDDESYSDFIADMQELWISYSDVDEYGYGTIYNLNVLLQEYSEAASTFSTTLTYKEELEEGYYKHIEFTAPSKGTYYLFVFCSYIVYTGGDFYFGAGVNLVMDATISRISGYVFGWILFGTGIISLGFATYSLITYSSEDEISRYEENLEYINQQEMINKSKNETEFVNKE